ncbi:hypothetical protein CDG81_20780 [Actinopolyspora erythraea]|uniref:Uncharacterized protein n=1 Tax=Actinopolyspora erythraea TaxID=414996 RepID=A0A099DA24_9ACTN|nr:hypothetical protein [Actinopolyspora erythraea]ASU80300.1 hypothetical protein CDG81_20780 [Actinopolyspora erythraea]KGI82617.1 hypothetical protein IL38_04100 [Actinopolyspora erythraea]
MNTHPAMLLGTAVLLAGTAIVLTLWGNRACYRPRHAGGSGPAARRLAALRLESYFRPEHPTTEVIRWPLCDPDRHPRLFEPAPPRAIPAPGPPTPEPAPPNSGTAPGNSAPTGVSGDPGTEHPELALMRRVLDGLHRL